MSDNKYSAENIRKFVANNGYTCLLHHDCGGCGVWVKYQFAGDNVFFNSNCECSNYWSPPRSSSYEEISEWLAMQSKDEYRDNIMKGFR